MTKLERNLTSTAPLGQSQTITEHRTTSADLINAAKSMSLAEKKAFLISLLDADDQAIRYAANRMEDSQIPPEREAKNSSSQGWMIPLQHLWNSMGGGLKPVEVVIAFLTLSLGMGWIKPLPNQIIVDPQRLDNITFVLKKEPSLESSQGNGDFGQRDLRQQTEDLLRREASGEISEEEFHRLYDELLNVNAQGSVIVRAKYQEDAQKIQHYELEFEPFTDDWTFE